VQKKNIYLIIVVILLVIILGGVYVMLYIKKPNTPANNSSVTISQSSATQQKVSSKDTVKLVIYKSLDIFTDYNGMTLYHDIQDWPRNTKPPYNPYTKCLGACSVTWLPFYVDSIKVSSPLKIGDFMVFTRPDGKKQVAYRGWPLYYYTGDSKSGDITGQSIGNIWYAGISPD
jgi:predicted lipoprotein with Yx(FWY)xxD motif